MSKPRIDAAVIERLRAMVIAHNEAHPENRVRLEQLRKQFAREWRGQVPVARAWNMVDRYLGKLAKAASPPGGEEFDPGKHPRDENGQFRRSTGKGAAAAGGGGRGGSTTPPSAPPPAPQPGRRAALQDVATPEDHQTLRDENAGYRAATTQVIPETRYSTYGPGVGYATGVLMGSVAGAAPGFAREGDRDTAHLAGRVAAWGGRQLASPVVGGAGELVDLVRVKVANRGADMARHEKTLRRSTAFGRVVGQGVEGIYNMYSATTLAPATLWHDMQYKKIGRSGATGLTRALMHGRRVAIGAAIGAAIPGAFINGPAMSATGAAVGPYLDAAMPRRVEKLAKVQASAESAELLEKLSLTQMGRAARSFGQHTFAGLRGMMPHLPRMGGHGGVAPVHAPHTPAPAAAAAGKRKRTPFGSASTVRPANVQGRAATTLARSGKATIGRVGLAAGVLGGAALGGVLGGGAAWGGHRVYYRDEHGKFTSKDRAVATGAGVGAVAGALAGLALIRGANRGILGRIAEGTDYGKQIRIAEREATFGGKTFLMGHEGAMARDANGRILPNKAARAANPETMAGTRSTRVNQTGALDPQMVAARAQAMAEAKARREVTRQGEKHIARVKPQLEAIDAAAKHPVEWNARLVREGLEERIAARLREPAPGSPRYDANLHTFWKEGQGQKAAAARRAFADGKEFERFLGKEQADEIGALRQKAQAHIDSYAGEVKALHDQKERHIEAVTAATERHKEAAEGVTKVERQMLDLKDKTDEASHAARGRLVTELSTAQVVEKDALKNLTAAQKRLRRSEEILESPDGIITGTDFPRAIDPWAGGARRSRVLPTDSEVEALRSKITGNIKARADQAAAKAGEEVASKIDEIVDRVREHVRAGGQGDPNMLERQARWLGAHVAGPLHEAAKDVARAGGEVRKVIRGMAGDAPDVLASYARGAKTRAANFVLGQEARMPDGTTKRVGGALDFLMRNKTVIIGTGATVLTAAELVQHDPTTGVMKPSLKKPKEIFDRLKGNTVPVYRVFNPGDAKNQVVITGIGTRDKKTGQVLLLQASVTRSMGANERTESLPPGAQLEDVIRQLRPERGPQNGQKAGIPVSKEVQEAAKKAVTELSNQDKLKTITVGDYSYKYRADPNIHTDMADKVMKGFIDDAENKGGDALSWGGGFKPHDYWERMREVVEGEGSELLTLQQRHRLLLGAKGDGAAKPKVRGIFSPAVRSAAGGNGQQLFDALKKEITSAMPYSSDENDRFAQAAIGILNHDRGNGRELSVDHIDELHKLIEANRGANGGKSNPGGGQPRQQRQPGEPRQRNGGSDGGANRAADLHQAAQEQLIDELRGHLDPDNDPDDRERRSTLEDTLPGYWTSAAERLRRGNPDLTENEILTRTRDHVKKTILRVWAEGEAASGGPRGAQARKAAGTGALRKGFEETRHPRAGRGSDHGGEFTRGSGAAAAAGRQAGHRQQQKPDQRGYFEPVRLGGTVGGAAGGAAGWEIASRYLPASLKSKGVVARFAATMAASMLGSAGGSLAGEAAGRATYTLRGARAPRTYEPPPRPLGEEVARAAGGFGGWEAASRGGKAVLAATGRAAAAANPVTNIAMSTVGMLGGEELASAAYHAVQGRFGDQIAARVGRVLGHTPAEPRRPHP